jgi:hypothetical protein
MDNDSGPGLVLTSITNGAHGVASMNVDGYSITYVPEADFSGDDFLTYLVCDQNGNCSTATIVVTVTPVNDPPQPGDDSLTVDEDASGQVAVLGNDSDRDGDLLIVVSVGSPAHGTAVIQPDGTVRYTPASDFSGSDSFDYVVSDDHGGTATATVLVFVNSVNDPPMAVDDTATTRGRRVVIRVMDNDNSGEAASGITVVSVTEANAGSVTKNSNGTVTYAPRSGSSGSDAFDYTICQTPVAVACDTARVTVVVRKPLVEGMPVTTQPPPTPTTRPNDPVQPSGTMVFGGHTDNGPNLQSNPHRDSLEAPSRETLPFTGAEILSIVAAGLILIMAGLALRTAKRG